MAIDKENGGLNIYNWTHDKIPIAELKAWVDRQIELGKTHVTLDIEWGYYDDIDSLMIHASK